MPKTFLSTPSGWRATAVCIDCASLRFCISIHALRVEGDFSEMAKMYKNYISIHALRVEGDVVETVFKRGAPISIHALRVEGDL